MEVTQWGTDYAAFHCPLWGAALMESFHLWEEQALVELYLLWGAGSSDLSGSRPGQFHYIQWGRLCGIFAPCGEQPWKSRLPSISLPLE